MLPNPGAVACGRQPQVKETRRMKIPTMLSLDDAMASYNKSSIKSLRLSATGSCLLRVKARLGECYIYYHCFKHDARTPPSLMITRKKTINS